MSLDGIEKLLFSTTLKCYEAQCLMNIVPQRTIVYLNDKTRANGNCGTQRSTVDQRCHPVWRCLILASGAVALK